MSYYSGYSNSKGKFFRHLGSLVIGFLQFICVFLGLVFIKTEMIFSIACAVFLLVLTFLEGKVKEYDGFLEYIICVIVSPLRVFVQFITFFRVIVSIIKKDYQFGATDYDQYSFVGKFVYVFCGINRMTSKDRNTRIKNYNTLEKLNEESLKEKERKRIEREKRQQEEAERRYRNRPSDANGHYFMKTTFGSCPVGGYSYSERRYFKNGTPYIEITYTLDYRKYKDQTNRQGFNASVGISRTMVKEKVQQNYNTYCRNYKNPIQYPTVIINVNPGRMFGTY